MAELAPGFFVTDLCAAGTAYLLDPAAIGIRLMDRGGKAVAMNPADFERLPGELRERVLDDLTRQEADAGLRRLQRHLRSCA